MRNSFAALIPVELNYLAQLSFQVYSTIEYTFIPLKCQMLLSEVLLSHIRLYIIIILRKVKEITRFVYFIF